MRKALLFITAAVLALAAHAQVAVPWKTLTSIPSPTVTATGDATGNVTFSASSVATLNLTLANTTITPGTYRSITIDSKGRATAGTNPTSLATEGITNGAKIDTFAALTWATDTAPYYTGTGTAGTYSLTAFARGVLGSVDAPTWRTATGSAPLASPGFTGTPTAPTPAVDTNTTQIASTAFVLGQASGSGDGTPAMDGTGARGTSTHYARADHTHPTDTSRAPVNSPAFTGTPTAPTAAATTNTTQIATTAFAEGEIARTTNPRAPRQGLVFDGTAGATIANVPAFGTGDFTIVAFCRKNSLATRGAILGGVGPAPSLYVRSDGVWGLSDLSTGDVLSATPFVAAKAQCLTVKRQSGTVTFGMNGVEEAGQTFTASFNNGVSKLGTATGSDYLWDGKLSVLIYNRALSSAEVLALYESGSPAAADYNNASNTSLVTGNDSTFTSDTGFWDQKDAGVTISGGVANIPDGKFFGSGSLPLLAGHRYRVTLTWTGGTALRYYSGDPGVSYVLASSSPGTVTFDVLASSTYGSLLFHIDGGGTLDNISIYRTGLLCAPEITGPGNGLVWSDTSGNGAHIVLPTSGVTWAVPGSGQNHVRGTTNTSGNQQLLGSYVFNSGLQLVRVRARARSGTPTVKYGSSSGGADIVASVALSTSWQVLTLANPIITGSNVSVWVQSNTTDVVETDVSVEPVAF